MDRNRGLDINALRQQLEDLFEEFLPAPSGRRHNGGRGGDQTQHLPLNLLETDDSFVLSAPLPGFQPEDVEITVRGQNVTLRAQHKTPPADQQNLTRHEWGQGVFQRSFELSAPVEAEQATAGFRQGVVSVTLPKATPTELHVEPGETDEQTETASEPAADAGAAAPEAASPAPEAGAPEKSSFYMAPGRGRRGRRHAPKNQEAAPAETPAEPEPIQQAENVQEAEPAEGSTAEEQAAGVFEASAEPAEAPAAEDEGEARAEDQAQQSSFGTDGDNDEATPVEESLLTVAEAVEAPDSVLDAAAVEEPAADAANADAERFAGEAEQAAQPPTD